MPTGSAVRLHGNRRCNHFSGSGLPAARSMFNSSRSGWLNRVMVSASQFAVSCHPSSAGFRERVCLVTGWTSERSRVRLPQRGTLDRGPLFRWRKIDLRRWNVATLQTTGGNLRLSERSCSRSVGDVAIDACARGVRPPRSASRIDRQPRPSSQRLHPRQLLKLLEDLRVPVGEKLFHFRVFQQPFHVALDGVEVSEFSPNCSWCAR